MTPTYVLTISGSDSSGGAGLQADNRGIHAVGAFPLNVLTAVTIQTPKGVEAVELLSAETVAMQLRLMLKRYPVAAIKSGMLGSVEIVRSVAAVLEAWPEIPYILDPVLGSTSGQSLLEPEAVDCVRSRLMPRALLTTPNLDELVILAGGASLEAAAALARACGQMLLVKGGHASSAECEEWLIDGEGRRECFMGQRVATANLRGTGCALSAMVAGGVAQGATLSNAVNQAKGLLSHSLQQHAEETWGSVGPGFY